ncbi:MAG: hypothetical protein COU69_03360 [Candidatus Pacebacteria bacterium CG10_big_fil_rev_8_21_14_0_10_56_10]|nr:MAG: hypothetical protein COU69_03360 [Candidatus Pacebacteria bacterium CG10_big_fil_rev_8_21_14_0_10_56_10]
MASVSIKQLVFTLGLLAALLLLLFFGDSFLGWYVVGAIGLLSFWQAIAQDRRYFLSAKDTKRLVGLWLVFVAAMAMAALFTHSVPLTLTQLIYYGIGLSIFWLVLTVPFTAVNTELLELGLVIMGVTLTVVSFVFFANPALASLLPGLNVLYASFGHNHLAAVLLLLIPIAWRQAINNAGRGKSSWAAVVVLYLGLLSSFGRVATVVGLLQLGWLTWLGRRRLGTLPWWVRRVLLPGVAVSFVLVMAAMAGFSTVSLINSEFSCPSGRFERQLCKPITSEARSLYWGQALAAFRDFPVTGYGPGTFGLINTRYRQNIYTNTSFAHNAFFQAFAESGLLGGTAFLILMIGLWWWASPTKQALTSGRSASMGLTKALTIGVTAIYVNALFDFDLSILGTFALSMVLLALLWRQRLVKRQTRPAVGTWLAMRVVNGVVGLGLLIAAMTNIGVNTLIGQGKVSQAFAVAPYFSNHLKLFEDSDQLTTDQHRQLRRIYAAHVSVWQSALGTAEHGLDENRVIESILKLDPWQSLYYSNVERYLDQGKLELAKTSLETELAHLSRQPEHEQYELREKLAERSFNLAEAYYAVKKLDLAVPWYQRGYELHPWVFTEHRLSILDQEIISSEDRQLLAGLAGVDGEHFGQFREELAELLAQEALLQAEDPVQDISLQVTRIVTVADWFRWQVWQELSIFFEQEIGEALSRGETSIATQRAGQWYLVWQAFGTHQADLQFEHKERLAELLIEEGNRMVVDRPDQTGKMYRRAARVVPWSLNSNQLWFERQLVPELTASASISYAQSNSDLAGELVGHKDQRHAQQRLKMVPKLVAVGEFQLARQSAQYYFPHRSQTDLETKVLASLQDLADDFLKTDNADFAQQTIAIMLVIRPDDYWVQAQQGNVLVAAGEYEQAKQVFAKCEAKWQASKPGASHDDCAYGLQALKEGKPQLERYWQVSQIIHGEAVWQDFVDG